MIDSWRERAACVGADPAIFHRLSAGDPGTEGMDGHARKKVEKQNFTKAKKLCSACPVKTECRAEGERTYFDSDGISSKASLFSVWGGETPEGWSGRGRGRPRKTGVRVDPRSGKPSRTVLQRHEDGDYDHPMDAVTYGGRTVCRTCKRAYDNARPARTEPIDYDARHLRNKGHAPVWRTRKSTGYRECATCEDARLKARRKTPSVV